MPTLKNKVRSMAMEKGWNLTNLAEKMGQSRANLNNKLTKETLRYKELLKLAEVLGRAIEWVDKDLKERD